MLPAVRKAAVAVGQSEDLSASVAAKAVVAQVVASAVAK
jgi:hypothetical protein